MLKFLPGSIRGSLSFLLILINTIFWCAWLYLVAILKLLIPVNGWRKFCNRILIAISNNWISCNNLNFRLTNDIRWDVSGVEELEMNEWYLVLANHQTWVDILVLQKIFNRKIPFLKFFIKKELLWVPFLGLAWWALDFPIMKRYSKEFLEKHPHLKGKDIETTRKACEKFKAIPISVMNFVEGTRFTAQKRAGQKSPYKNLLKPKAAGIAFVLATMGEQIKCILDVTIAYPDGAKSLWPFLCGAVGEVRVSVKSLPIHEEILGDYYEDERFREQFQVWTNTLWDEKDKEVDELLHKSD